MSIPEAISEIPALVLDERAADIATAIGAGLKAGRHVFAPRIDTLAPSEAERLTAVAHRLGLVVQTGHAVRLWAQRNDLFRADARPRSVCIDAGGPVVTGAVAGAPAALIEGLDLAAALFGVSPLSCEAARSEHALASRMEFVGGEARCEASLGGPEYLRVAVRFRDGGTAMFTERARWRSENEARFLRAIAGLEACPAPLSAGAAGLRLLGRLNAAVTETTVHCPR